MTDKGEDETGGENDMAACTCCATSALARMEEPLLPGSDVARERSRDDNGGKGDKGAGGKGRSAGKFMPCAPTTGPVIARGMAAARSRARSHALSAPIVSGAALTPTCTHQPRSLVASWTA